MSQSFFITCDPAKYGDEVFYFAKVGLPNQLTCHGMARTPGRAVGFAMRDFADAFIKGSLQLSIPDFDKDSLPEILDITCQRVEMEAVSDEHI